MTKKTADMRTYHREWSRAKRQGDPEYAEKRKQYRLANYERVREQERRSKEKRREKDREQSREYMRRKRREEPELMREKNRQAHYRAKYKMSVEEGEVMFKAQGSACAICRTQDNNGRRWHTDHCHTSGRVRGILCNHCNLMLGHARDNPTTLIAAAKYLCNSEE